MRKLAIRAGGREILGNPRRDATSGAVVAPDGLQGWTGLPAGRREALARAVQHGEHDVPVYLPSRVVTVDGYVYGGSDEELGQEIDRLTGIGASGERFRVSIEMYGGTRFADARRIACTVDDPGFRGGSLIADFQLQMLFADPRKYGETINLPGDRENPVNPAAVATSIPVFHYGNFPAFPVIEIPSAPAAYTISAGGKTFAVAGATSGGTHAVHLRNGRVYRNGVEMQGVGRGDLWAVSPGASLTHSLSVAGRAKIPNTYV